VVAAVGVVVAAAPAPDSLAQFQGDSATMIPTGASVPGVVIVVRAFVPDTQPFRLEVEVVRVGAAYSGQATAASDVISGAGRVHVRVGGLVDGTAYHWRARVVPETGSPSSWRSYGNNSESSTDVKVGVPVTGPKLVFTRQPPTTTAGETMPPVEVTVVDGQGNTVSSFTGTVFLGISDGPPGGALGGTPQANAVGGVATFSDLRITTAGSYRIEARTDGASTGTSTAFGINPGPIDHLVFLNQPSNGHPNQPLTPALRVAARDVYANVVTSFTDVVYMNIENDGSPTKNAQLDVSGTHRAAAAGIATFEDLKLNQLGVGYTLQASAANTRPATTAPFDIIP
jgi:hypothetical protein